MVKELPAVFKRCDDCEELVNTNENKVFLMQSEDGWVKGICKHCLDSYDKEQRIIH